MTLDATVTLPAESQMRTGLPSSVEATAHSELASNELPDVLETVAPTPRPSFFERAFRSKIHRMYGKTIQRSADAPVRVPRAQQKRDRKAAKRRAEFHGAC